MNNKENNFDKETNTEEKEENTEKQTTFNLNNFTNDEPTKQPQNQQRMNKERNIPNATSSKNLNKNKKENQNKNNKKRQSKNQKKNKKGFSSKDLLSITSRSQLKFLTKDQKKERRKLKNRISARNSRERVKQKVVDLQQHVGELEQENQNLKKEVENLHQEMNQLQQQLKGPDNFIFQQQNAEERQITSQIMANFQMSGYRFVYPNDYIPPPSNFPSNSQMN
ncbi:basic-leucine zipper transcription factor f-related [Anaeramoeba ignava]|uniref:Basic-leucine zipper transcription factor f-related n=1 Tax=Anaeramoeba ignava TaxID=1746090 RepID=A0A9Q0LXD0_ANAIG|nr:basic-leucine zipper transcription factor f-related [Anaeramoeba ignava]